MNTTLFDARRAWERGDLSGALSGLRELARRPDAPVDVLISLADLCAQQGLWKEAIEAAELATIREASNPRSWQKLASLSLRAQDFATAQRALERLLELEPQSPAARINLGIVLQQQNKPAEAVTQHREALRLAPTNAMAHSNLAASLASLGQFDDALAHAKEAIRSQPSFLNAYMLAAFIETDRGRFPEALRWIEQVPPDLMRNAPALTSHAEILVKAERYGEGLKACDEAIRLDPKYSDAHLCRASALGSLGRLEEALASYDTAASLNPSAAMPLAKKAATLLEFARMAEAQDLFDRACALEPRSPSVLCMRAGAKEYRLDDAEIASLEDLLPDENSYPPAERASLHFALASAYLAAGRHSRVFPHLETGSRIKRATVPYDPVAAEDYFRAIPKVFTPALMSGAEGDPSERMIFVVGVPRSGTTLVEQILAAHPLIDGRGELHEMPAVLANYEKKFRENFPGWIGRLAPDDFRALGASYLERVGEPAAGKTRIVDKLPSNLLNAGLINCALPNARIVLCRRDPFDTCFSCYMHLFTNGQGFTYDLSELGKCFRMHEELMAYWHSVLPSNRFLEVRYEDVISDIEGSARKLIAFCGLDWSDTCLRFHESPRQVRTASLLQVRKPLYSNSGGRWRPFRKELSPLFEALGMRPPD